MSEELGCLEKREPTLSRGGKNENVKYGCYSGHFWRFDFLFFEIGTTLPGLI